MLTGPGVKASFKLRPSEAASSGSTTGSKLNDCSERLGQHDLKETATSVIAGFAYF